MPAANAVSEEDSSASSGPSLADSIGEMLGDYRTEEESPDSDETSAAGTTPAEPATDSETDLPAAEDGAIALSDGTTPDTPPATASDESDPFADTTPATFTVNGVAVTNEDIRVFKEGGAVIRPEALPNVLNRLSERESLFERNRAQSQEYQTLARVTEWTDPQSNKTYTGPEAAIEMRIGNAALLAENNLLVEYLTDPDKLFSILGSEMIPDGKGGMVERVVLRPDALASLQTQNELRQLKSAQAIRTHFAGIVAESSKAQPAPVNYEKATPELLTQIASGASLDASVLTAQDRQLLAEQLPFHTKDGQASVAWQNLAKSMMRDRASQKTSTQNIVSATEKATREGQARLAAAARGVRPATRPIVPVTRTPTQDNSRAENEGDMFDSQLNAGARALRSSL